MKISTKIMELREKVLRGAVTNDNFCELAELCSTMAVRIEAIDDRTQLLLNYTIGEKKKCDVKDVEQKPTKESDLK